MKLFSLSSPCVCLVTNRRHVKAREVALVINWQGFYFCTLRLINMESPEPHLLRNLDTVLVVVVVVVVVVDLDPNGCCTCLYFNNDL